MGKAFKIDTEIPWFLTDIHGVLKPAGFMDFAQEMANEAAEQLGFGFDTLAERGCAWVLSRVHIIYHDAPRWREQAHLATWHKGLSGPFFVRDFLLKDNDGRIRVSATSSWVVMDTVSRRLVRADALSDIIPGTPQCEEDAIEENVRKIVFPRGIAPANAASHAVSYTDVDKLGHTNNACYLAWAMDCLPQDISMSQTPREIYLNILKETHMGETVELKLWQETNENGQTFWLEGLAAGVPVFSCKIILRS